MPSCRGNPVGQLSVVCGDRRDVIWMGMTEKPPTDPGDHAQEFTAYGQTCLKNNARSACRNSASLTT